MRIQQKKYSAPHGWETLTSESFPNNSCNMVLVFGSTTLLEDPAIYEYVRKDYPQADIIMNSTAGEIYDVEVNDDTISLTAICFEKTAIKATSINIKDVETSRKAGNSIAAAFDHMNLKSILIISDGQNVNGTEFVQGLQECLHEEIVITGGLAGDGARFKKTLVGLNEVPIEGRIAAVGFYGDNLVIGYGSMGGWDSFGPERLITKSKDNVLYELDGKPALDMYKLYLGEYANELPGSGLLFPLSIRSDEHGESIVRTILGIDESAKSLVFAGNMPEGSYARLMTANFDRLIDGASLAAKNSVTVKDNNPELAILISCVGRKLVLNQRIEEEVEVVRAAYGKATSITGFYSYGEISPSFKFLKCELHNQTMTITTLSER